MAEGDAMTLQAAADWLQALSGSIAHRGAVPPPPNGPASVPSGLHEVPDALAALAAAAASDSVLPRGAHHGLPRPRLPHGELSLSHLTVGRTVLLRAAALSLCIAIAYATRYVFHEEHWYWVPLTVAMVMKPELGSVFVRTVLRAGGTSLGVVIGIALLHFLPQGPYMIAALALIGAFLPLAKSLSYGVQTLVLTPLVLILLELIAPASRGIGYGEQRFLATLIGGLIVLVFGYFLWPRGHARELSQQFDAALGTTAAYLVAAFSGGAGDRAPVIAAERAAYAQLSDLRAALGRSMAEPPPVGREAAAWFPLVVAAERICDRITAGAPAPGSAQRPSEEEIAAVADRLRALVSGAEGVTRVSAPAVMPQDPALRAIAAEAEQLSRRLASVAEGQRHAGPPHPAT
jgi:uncharacterized membrane protein YccC